MWTPCLEMRGRCCKLSEIISQMLTLQDLSSKEARWSSPSISYIFLMVTPIYSSSVFVQIPSGHVYTLSVRVSNFLPLSAEAIHVFSVSSDVTPFTMTLSGNSVMQYGQPIRLHARVEPTLCSVDYDNVEVRKTWLYHSSFFPTLLFVINRHWSEVDNYCRAVLVHVQRERCRRLEFWRDERTNTCRASRQLQHSRQLHLQLQRIWYVPYKTPKSLITCKLSHILPFFDSFHHKRWKQSGDPASFFWRHCCGSTSHCRSCPSWNNLDAVNWYSHSRRLAVFQSERGKWPPTPSRAGPAKPMRIIMA